MKGYHLFRTSVIFPPRGRAIDAATLVGGECKGDIRLDESLVAYISSKDPLAAFPTSWSVA